VDIVDRISLAIPRGKVVALVGESGCGKSITALSILRLLPKPAVRMTDGRIVWYGDDPKFKVQSSKFKNGVDLVQFSDHEMRTVRGREIAMIFQEPMTALNPVFSVGEQIVEVVMLHRRIKRRSLGCAADLLKQVVWTRTAASVIFRINSPK
jgi:peptide/nickel transport system ATP-binding protein/oligopeptide transport system ATP-binding protein